MPTSFYPVSCPQNIAYLAPAEDVVGGHWDVEVPEDLRDLITNMTFRHTVTLAGRQTWPQLNVHTTTTNIDFCSTSPLFTPSPLFTLTFMDICRNEWTGEVCFIFHSTSTQVTGQSGDEMSVDTELKITKNTWKIHKDKTNHSRSKLALNHKICTKVAQI